MKLMNFRSLDPGYHGAGLRAVGRLDRAVWDDFVPRCREADQCRFAPLLFSPHSGSSHYRSGSPQQTPPAPAPARQATPPYGSPLTLETARRVAAGAEAEARRNGWPVAVAVVDSTGHLVLFEKLDNTQYGSIELATLKAMTALNYRRPGKALQDALAGGGVGWGCSTCPRQRL